MSNVRRNCPFCFSRTGSYGRRENVSINVEEGVFYCWRCGASGRLKESTARLLDVPFDPNAQRLDDVRAVESYPNKNPTKTLPDGYVPLWLDVSSVALSRYWKFCTSRGITKLHASFFQLGVVLDGGERRSLGSIVFPMLDVENPGWVLRRIDRRGYRNSVGLKRATAIYNARAIQHEADRGCVYVVEGPIDAIRLGNAVATLGKDIALSQLDRLASYPGDLVVAMDGDAWAYSRAICGRLRLRGKRNVGWTRLPPGHDPGSLGEETKSLEVYK